jgi:predicted nucleic acid-binding protein
MTLLIVGLDSNILCYAMDPAYPESRICRKYLIDLSPGRRIALNPTVVHETYHVLVYSQKWEPSDARNRLQAIITHPSIAFLNQTRTTSSVGLKIAEDNKIGGRDSLILSNYVTNKVTELHTHDKELTNLRKISWKNTTLNIIDPIEKPQR